MPSNAPSPPAPTILVVEDEGTVRLDIVEHLRECGFRVLEAADGPRALQLLQSAMGVDLVFTDIMMPGKPDGMALAQWIRSHLPALPVILTSGSAGMASMARANCRNEPFVAKPYDPAAVAARIRDLLSNAR